MEKKVFKKFKYDDPNSIKIRKIIFSTQGNKQ